MAHQTALVDPKVHIKIVISGLWVALMFCYVYGDFFTLLVPGHLDTLNAGKMGLGETTPWKILIAAIIVVVPALMIPLSLMLRAGMNRLLNIVASMIYILIMVLVIIASIDPWWLFYIFLGVIEISISSLIFWMAVKWPRE